MSTTTPPNRALEFFNQMKRSFLEKISEEDREKYRAFGERFYHSFDIESGHPFDTRSSISLEESLAYLVESLKAGLHPAYLTLEERALVEAAYGDQWYRRFGYDSDRIEFGSDSHNDSCKKER